MRQGVAALSYSYIPQKIQNALWANAAGRCEFRGCNKELIGDLVAGREYGKFGFIAHIVADSDKGPRGDPVKSPLLKQDLSNLMLLCAHHHKGVDVDWVVDYWPVWRECSPECSLEAMRRPEDGQQRHVSPLP